VEAERKRGAVIMRPLQETTEGRRVEWRWRCAGQGLREERERFESAFSNAPIGMALMGMDGRWFQVNSALCRITGCSEDELKATKLRSLIHPEDVDLDLQLLQQVLDGQIPSYQTEKRCRHAWGHFVWVLMTVSLVRSHKGQARYLITQFQDISERKELSRRLEFLVDHDFLTGLFNRRHFEQELAQEMERSARYGFSGAVLLIDLDNFKDVNDTFGHMAGDDLLRGIGGLMRHRLRRTDTLARVGGDEFAVLLPQTDGDQARVLADEFVKALSRQTAVHANQSIRITVSVGVAMFDNNGNAEAMACADLAMYEAKQAGRNRFVVYEPGSIGGGPDSVRRGEVGRIHRAVEEDRLLLYCQPIIDLKRMEVSQYELLLRLPGCDGIYKRFYPGAQGKSGRTREKFRGELGAGSEWPGGNRFLSGQQPGNSLPAPKRAVGPLRYGLALGHTSAGRAPGRHPDGMLVTLSNIIVCGTRCAAAAERGARMDSATCSARFGDGAGCGRRPVGL